MKRMRLKAASTVFQGRIVVFGGGNSCSYATKSVEEYDNYENKLNYLPDMLEKRRSHSACSMGNKMFIIGGHSHKSCEVFESFSRKFVYIQKAPINYSETKATCLGNQIYAYALNVSKVFVYNTNENNWSIKKLKLNNTKHYTQLNCVKRPYAIKGNILNSSEFVSENNSNCPYSLSDSDRRVSDFLSEPAKNSTFSLSVSSNSEISSFTASVSDQDLTVSQSNLDLSEKKFESY